MIPPLPPAARSRAALGLTAAAARGRFELQVCTACGAVQYPSREACHRCLGIELAWRAQDGRGELIAETTIHHSHDPYFRERLPWRIGLVRLDAGPSLVAHLPSACPAAPSRVVVAVRLDRAGRGVLIAFPPEEPANMSDDRQLREMSCSVKSRKILVTDGKTPLGRALVRAVLAAGAGRVWVGHAGSWKDLPDLAALGALPGVAFVPLDVTDGCAVRALAGEIGGDVDILINNAEMHGAPGVASGGGLETARAEMDVNYFGLLRLAQDFAPALRSRAAGGASGASAWVNILSVFALSSFPAHGTFSASKAAALSLSQALRAEMRCAGIRVINVFPGPLDDESSRALPAPKLAPEALAAAVVAGLRDGIEDLYPGEIAQEWLARYRDDPKVLELELAVAEPRR
ncbi:MAG TPA: SDR family NAD(P)-dependent oxidoreductase [Steroidobacteraceae bacterium]|nr:SDR family NAD(P)-dependent oxidoreductase [Steroidobacteraceae bacterium]